MDSTGAVAPGAIVTISSASLIGGPLRARSAADGIYRISALPSGLYDSEVELNGFRPLVREGVRVPAGATIRVNVELEVAGITDVLTVTGRSPMIDVASAASQTTIDVDQLFHLPVERNISKLINLVPGVSADVSFGGSQEGNELLIDGVGTTSPDLQEPWTRFAHNWVQEVHVSALGADAEHGGFTGVVANSTLRSGGNRFSGLLEYWSIGPGWLANNTRSLSDRLQDRFASRRIRTWWETSAQLGGPIARDRAWFFAGLQALRHDDQPAGFDGPGSRDARDLQAIAKLSAAPDSQLRVEGFYQQGRYRVTAEDVGPFTPIDVSSDFAQPQRSWNARLNKTLGPQTLLGIHHGGYASEASTEPHPPNTRDGPPPHLDLNTGELSGNAFIFSAADAAYSVTSAHLTHFVTDVAGTSHDLKLGIDYEWSHTRQEVGFPGGQVFWDFDGVPVEVSLWDGDTVRATTNRVVLYAQDTWKVGNRLTVRPGVRVALNRGSVPDRGTIFTTSPVSPRIGVAWVLTGDYRTVARVHYGRYHDALFSSRIMFGDTSGQTPTINAEVVGPGEFVEIDRFDPQDNYAIDENIEHSYVDQFVVGVERELVEDLSVVVQYVRRNFDRFMGLIDTGSIYRPVERQDPGPDGRLGTVDDGELLTVFELTNPGNKFRVYTNPEEAFNRFNAVQLIAHKRYSAGWQLQGSYTWSKAEGTVGNRWHVNAARFNLGDPGNFVNPNRFINAFGRGPFDPTHEAKLLGTYRAPFWGGLNLSAVYRYTTGYAGNRAARLRLPQGRETVKVEPNGSRRTPAINQLDMRLEKTVEVGSSGPRIGVFLEVFNLTNQGVPDAEAGCCSHPVQNISGSTFGQPLRWVDPRLLRASVRFTF